MRNREQLLNALTDIRDEYIAEADAPALPVSRRRVYRIGAVAAAACLIVAGVGIWQRHRPSVAAPLPPPESSAGDWTDNEDDCLLIPWDELSITAQYSTLLLDGHEYSGSGAVLPTEKQGQPLGTYTLSGFDEINNVAHHRQAAVFAVTDMASACAVAVRFEEDPALYVYVNTMDYRPATLGQFVDDLNLRENLQIGSVYTPYYQKKNGDMASMEYTGLPTSVVLDLLLSSRDAVCTEWTDSIDETKIMGVSATVSLVGSRNKTISVTEDGYLFTNILETGKAFSIGADKTQAFAAYVRQHCRGVEHVLPSEPPDNGEPEADEGDATRVTTVVTAVSAYGSADIAPFTEKSVMAQSVALLQGKVTNRYDKHYTYTRPGEQMEVQTDTVVYELTVDRVWYGEGFTQTTYLIEDEDDPIDQPCKLQVGERYVVPIYRYGDQLYTGDVRRKSPYSSTYPFQPAIRLTEAGEYIVPAGWTTLTARSTACAADKETGVSLRRVTAADFERQLPILLAATKQ